jgi:EAL domain-containing protein (putative c-di-GMP-specific phosphodiesterase class I)
MMPSDWLPTAEYLNLMPEIGVRALQLLGDFLTQRHSPRPPVDHWICSINASSEQLHDAAFLELASKLPAVGIQTGCQVMYEIVEGDISDARETIVPNLRNLRLAGAKICIDDFGSKYTSLTYLQRWPIDWLKIDRTLTAAIASQPDSDASLALVAATIAMTRALSFGSAAQDVENEEQHLALAQIGFDLAQGAHWTRPVKLARLGDLWSVPPHG